MIKFFNCIVNVIFVERYLGMTIKSIHLIQQSLWIWPSTPLNFNIFRGLKHQNLSDALSPFIIRSLFEKQESVHAGNGARRFGSI